MLNNISNAINILTVFQLAVLIYVVYTAKNRNTKELFLVLLLAVSTFLVAILILDSYKLLPIANHPYFDIVVKATFLLIGPLVYFYTVSSCQPSFKLRKHDWIHLIPALIVMISVFTDYSIRRYNESSGSTTPLFSQTTYFVYSILFLGQFLFYIIKSFFSLNKYRSGLKTIYSSLEKVNLSWLKFLLVVLTFHWLFDAGTPLLVLLGIWDSNIFLILNILSVSTLLLFCTFVVIKGLKQATVMDIIPVKPKYAESNVSETDIQLYVSSLIEYMKTAKPYLNPMLKLNDLADNLSIPAKSLSQAINQELGHNFFDFINKYRINEAKTKMKHSNGEATTILEILFESGFNSKAAFNRAFKKHTGVTPSQFKSDIM